MTDATCYETFMHFPTDIKLMRGRTYHTHNQHIKLRTATRLEGSFGTQKLHYSLLKVRARTQATELLWIYFGIHTANAVKMIKKIAKKSLRQSD